MDNALNMIGGLVKSLTSILVGVVGLGVVAGVVFGDTWFFGDVLNNLVALIQGLGDAGLVGLLAAAILIGLLGQFYLVIVTAVVIEKYISYANKKE